jgi:biotin operon repressor
MTIDQMVLEHYGSTLSGVTQARKYLDEKEAELVLAARSAGSSWGRIAADLDRSRQAVWEKYRMYEDAGRRVQADLERIRAVRPQDVLGPTASLFYSTFDETATE